MAYVNSHKRTILVVDDSPENLNLMAEILQDDYRVKVALSGAKALDIVRSESPPDLILLDIMMPDMDGYEVCQRLKSHPVTRKIPVIFLSALNETHDETKGFEVGGLDYITKPISVPIVQARVKTHLALYDQTLTLEEMVKERTRDLEITQDATIFGLATLAEYRDNETGGHILRTQNYVRVLADHLRTHSGFSNQLNEEMVDLLFKSAPLHDIGKVGIPDHILKKPGKLTDEEFREMDRHVIYGRDAIVEAESKLRLHKGQSSFLRFAREIAYSHHERWDGTGFPGNLKGDEIPLSARLMAVADVYDALISKRVYKPPFPHQKAIEIILEGRGTHFDPEIVEAFVELDGTFLEIALELADNEDVRKTLRQVSV